MFPVIWWMMAKLYFLIFRSALRGAVPQEHVVPQKTETSDNSNNFKEDDIIHTMLTNDNYSI